MHSVARHSGRLLDFQHEIRLDTRDIDPRPDLPDCQRGQSYNSRRNTSLDTIPARFHTYLKHQMDWHHSQNDLQE